MIVWKILAELYGVQVLGQMRVYCVLCQHINQSTYPGGSPVCEQKELFMEGLARGAGTEFGMWLVRLLQQ